MEPINWHSFFFLLFALVACGFALAVVLTSNVVRMAFYLVLSLTPLGEPASDRPWITENLTEGELAVWRSMSRADRRHAAGVARRVERALGHEATRPVIAAALLHDCGKTVSGLGTYGRVIATTTIWLAGKESVAAWTQTRGLWRRIGLYAEYPRLGAEALTLAPGGVGTSFSGT